MIKIAAAPGKNLTLRRIMDNHNLNIVIGGEAGLGLATIGQALSRSLVCCGFHLHVSQTYESRIRGGHNTFALRTGSKPTYAPLDSIDLLIALDRPSIPIHEKQLLPSACLISDESLDKFNERHLRIPTATLGKKLYVNTIMLGVAGALLNLEQSVLIDSVTDQLNKLSDEILQENKIALQKAYKWLQAQKPSFTALTAPAFAPLSKIVLNGSEALALGAMSAGLKLCSFYPMSPGTAISLAIADAARELGIVVEQAEDEIAAINMAIGASYAGARAMVATSGGGFSLMCEGVSLAGMIETPLVIMIAMRPGPATGLPTRTEQADLNLALYAGHGEFPRAIFAPGTLEQSVTLTQHAFHLTEQCQAPVFVLTDQYLNDSYRDVKPFEFSDIPALADTIKAPPDGQAYARFAITENGVSPRALPGHGKYTVVSDSDEHTPDGHITEDLGLRVKMQNKRMAKLALLTHQALAPDFSGDAGPDILLCCWGSTIGAVLEAANILRAENKKIGVCHFTQVYPLKTESFMPQFNAARRVIMVEGNFKGQLADLIGQLTGFAVHSRVLRYDGLAITASYILDNLKQEISS